jgi:Tol biopolymer transport system component
VAWTGSGREVVYFENESALEGGLGVNAGTANVMRRGVPFGSLEKLSWSPSSSMVLDIVGPGAVVFDSCSPRASVREIPLPGSGPPRWLTRGNSNDRQPAYSRDGEWVIFSSNRSGNLDLWQVSRKTGIVRRLTEDAAEDWDPAFMPDGERILWSSNRSGHFEIWIAQADGSGARQVSNDGVDAENPTATADGRWIVYVSTNPAKAGIWKVRPDGGGAVRLIEGTYAMPEVSPDGRYALYSANYMAQRVPLRVVEVETGRRVPFEIEIAVPAGKPRVALGRARWMPDGRAIAFIGQDEQGVTGIYAQDFVPGKDTAAMRRKLGGFDAELTTESFGISPDGSRLAIASWEQLFSLMLAERIPGVARVRAAAR